MKIKLVASVAALLLLTALSSYSIVTAEDNDTYLPSVLSDRPPTPTNTPTNTPVPTETERPTDTPTNTPTNTPTATPTNTPTNTPVVTPSPTTLVGEGIEVQGNYSGYLNTLGQFEVVGEIKNNRNDIAHEVATKVGLFNAASQLLAEQLGPAAVPQLLPGETTCFSARFAGPLYFATSTIQFAEPIYNLNVPPLASRNVSINSTGTYDTIGGAFLVSGTVVNGDSVPLETWVAVSIRDDVSGRVIRCQWGKTNIFPLAPGAASTYVVAIPMPPPLGPLSFKAQPYGWLPD